MALFNKEPEKNPKIQPTTTPIGSATSSAPASSTSSTSPAAAPRANGPAPADGRAYLDRGSKISGKISFEGPARIDGEVDGEINAKDSLTIGESAVITAHIRAALGLGRGQGQWRYRRDPANRNPSVGQSQREYHGARAVDSRRRAIRGPLLDAARGRSRRPQSHSIPQGGARAASRRRRAEAGLSCPGRFSNSPRSYFPMMERTSTVPPGETP